MKPLMCVCGELDVDFCVRIVVEIDKTMPFEVFDDVVDSVHKAFNAYQKEAQKIDEKKTFDSEIKNPVLIKNPVGCDVTY